MGAAKRKGTFEERKAMAIERNKQKEKDSLRSNGRIRTSSRSKLVTTVGVMLSGMYSKEK